MSHARGLASMTLAAIITLGGCATDATAPATPNYGGYDPTCFGNGTNVRVAVPAGAIGRGNSGLSLSTMPPGTTHQLEQVIVYGSPVQRPYRGYGDITTYGGITTTYTYNRDELDLCSFGDGRTGVPVGVVQDDTLDVPIDPPEGISPDDWARVPPRVKRQLLEAASQLADQFLLNDIPEVGVFSRETRKAYFYAVLSKAYERSEAQLPDRRTGAVDLIRSSRPSDYVISPAEYLRMDAFLLGCATAALFSQFTSWNGSQAVDWASRVTSAWAAERTNYGAYSYLEPQLGMLGALGATAGREGSSCGPTAVNHFRQKPNDLFDTGRGNGAGGNDTQF